MSCWTARLIREEPDLVRQAIRNRGSDFDVDELIRLDERRRELLEVEQLKAERNRLSKEIGEAIKGGGNADDLRGQVNDLKERIGAMEAELAEVDALFDLRMLEIPNIPLPEVPVGASEEDNVVLHERGKKPSFDFDPLPHWELGEQLGILSFATAAKMAGARFACDIDGAAQLERALMNLMLDTHTRQHGYTEIGPPFLANAQSLIGTGSLPKFEEDLFKTHHGALSDSDRRGAADEHPPGRHPRSGRPAEVLHGVHALLPQRGRRRRAGVARPHPPAPVQQGRADEVHHSRDRSG